MKQAAQQGFSIVAAIFILVVLAALGAFALGISTTQQIGSAMDVQGARAYQAARAGIEWGLYQVQAYTLGSGNGYRFGADCPTTDTGAQCINRRSCANASGSFALPDTAVSLSSFTVTVVCGSFPDSTYGGPTVFKLTATACNQPTGTTCPNTTTADANYIERRLEIIF